MIIFKLLYILTLNKKVCPTIQLFITFSRKLAVLNLKKYNNKKLILLKMSFWMQKNCREPIVPTLTLQFCVHYSIEIGSFLLRLETFSKRDEPSKLAYVHHTQS